MGPPLTKRMKLSLLLSAEELFFAGTSQQTVSSPATLRLIHLWRKTNCSKPSKWIPALENDEHFRCKLYFETWIPRYLEYDFFLLFRLRNKTFQSLMSVFGHHMNGKGYRGGYFPIDLEKSILISIAYLARKETILTISDRFNVSCSTVHFCVTKFLRILTRVLMRKFITWPSREQAQSNERKFKDICGFPGVIGAIDGCHIKAKVPISQQDSYQDRKSQHSISLQGICSPEKLFINISTGFPGSLHDARILKESNLHQNILVNGEDEYFYGRFHLVGDSAYPCKNWLMCPYRDNGYLLPEERNFNFLLSRTRVRIENTFGLLKGRWRILKDIDTNSIERAVSIIIGCCVLHNFCILEGDHIETEECQDNIRGVYEGGEEDDRGTNKRTEITDYLWQNRRSQHSSAH